MMHTHIGEGTVVPVILFVGERRSNMAKKMGITWIDGGLAAKPLFDALNAAGIDPKLQQYINFFERGGKTALRKHKGPVVAMGSKVQSALTQRRIKFIPLVHPAARGAIRKRERYIAHVIEALAPITGKTAVQVFVDCEGCINGDCALCEGERFIAGKPCVNCGGDGKCRDCGGDGRVATP